MRCPELTGGDPLCRQGQSLRHGEPIVTQDGSDQLIGEDLGPMRPHGDGSLPLCLTNQLMCLLWALGMLVRDGWQVGIKNHVCSHGLTIWFRWQNKIGRRSYFCSGGS